MVFFAINRRRWTGWRNSWHTNGSSSSCRPKSRLLSISSITKRVDCRLQYWSALPHCSNVSAICFVPPPHTHTHHHVEGITILGAILDEFLTRLPLGEQSIVWQGCRCGAAVDTPFPLASEYSAYLTHLTMEGIAIATQGKHGLMLIKRRLWFFSN